MSYSLRCLISIIRESCTPSHRNQNIALKPIAANSSTRFESGYRAAAAPPMTRTDVVGEEVAGLTVVGELVCDDDDDDDDDLGVDDDDVDDSAPVSAARVEPAALSVGTSLVTTPEVAPAVAAAKPKSVVDPAAALVMVELSLPVSVAEAKAVLAMALALAPKVGYGPVLKLPSWPSGSV